MQLYGKAYRVSIYIGEANQDRGRPLYLALLELLRREGASGATVVRGVAGFGARSRIHTAAILSLSTDLPLIVTWVDVAERVDRLLPQIRRMVDDGLITLEPVEVIQYAPGRWPDPLDQPVAHVMRTQVVSVGPHTPLVDALALLLERGYRSLPVTDADGRLLGILTDGDLLRRAGLQARLGLQSTLGQTEVAAQMAAIRALGDPPGSATVQEFMTYPVVTVSDQESVGQAVQRMVAHALKRLPVVDGQGRLVGWLSRVDLLRLVDYHQRGPRPGGWGRSPDGQDETAQPPRLGATVADLMYTDVPTVSEDADLETIMQALERNQRRRAVVVDRQGRVVGIVTDGDLLRRSQAAHTSGLLDRLRQLITPGEAARHAPLPPGELTAAHIMSAPAITITPHTPLSEALELMVDRQVKRLPVVDEHGRLLGLLGRASLLRGLLEGR